jgi:hypothetical protein
MVEEILRQGGGGGEWGKMQGDGGKREKRVYEQTNRP